MSRRTAAARHARRNRGGHDAGATLTSVVDQPLNPDGDYGTNVGWFHTLADLDEAKRMGHDTLVALMGDRRTGPICWRWYEGANAARFLDQYQAGQTAGTAEFEYVRAVRAHLREYGGFVLLTIAEGNPR